MSHLAQVEVCFSPLLLSGEKKRRYQVMVVLDLIRASTSIVQAFAVGVDSILPVAETEEAIEKRQPGFLISGERDSHKISGFDLGNSPFEFLNPSLEGRSIIMTTTNGTRAIRAADQAREVLIGSLHNVDALCTKLDQLSQDCLLLCAGWKGEPSIEDILLAGRIARRLTEQHPFISASDSVHMALGLEQAAGDDWFNFILDRSPRLRSKLSWMENDIRFCLEPGNLSIVPAMNGGWLRVDA